MCVCTFFGHRDCPESIRPLLQAAIVDLIEKHRVRLFYVGNEGNFDRMARRILQELIPFYPFINYYLVMARLPPPSRPLDITPEEKTHTVLPPDFEKTPPRFAIDRRNHYMLKQADFVVTYVTHSFGGAAKFAQMATRQKKIVIPLTPAT